MGRQNKARNKSEDAKAKEHIGEAAENEQLEAERRAEAEQAAQAREYSKNAAEDVRHAWRM